MRRKFVIFSDLDGTLLDHYTYSFIAAFPALELIKSRGVPLVLCTSKTSAEINLYRNLLQNSDPFISENGGGIFIPKTYFSHDFSYERESNNYKVIELGIPYRILIETLSSIKQETGINLKGFSDMTVEEVSTISGFNPETAKLAKEREYDEPFLIFGDEAEKDRIKAEISRRGFNYAEGGRFHHIMGGGTDKGKAVKILIDIFKKNFSDLQTVGIGDSLNDLPMLEAVDIPIVVCNPNGKPHPKINLSNLVLAEGVGPEGWKKGVFNLFQTDM